MDLAELLDLHAKSWKDDFFFLAASFIRYLECVAEDSLRLIDCIVLGSGIGLINPAGLVISRTRGVIDKQKIKSTTQVNSSINK